MKCHRAKQLLAAQDPASRPLRDHLADCPECTAYGRRLNAVFEALGAHHVTVTPPAGFAARVSGRLGTGDDPLGWAALRLLPATVAVVLLLSWLNLRAGQPASDQLTDPTTAVLSWVLDSATEQPGVEGTAVRGIDAEAMPPGEDG